MKRIPVLIDCDPGVDDAAALLLANQIPELDIQAVTTVAGNVEVEQTTVNAQKIRSLINGTFPIYRGAEKPMVRTLVTAPQFHGADGLGGVVNNSRGILCAYKKDGGLYYESARKAAIAMQEDLSRTIGKMGR